MANFNITVADGVINVVSDAATQVASDAAVAAADAAAASAQVAGAFSGPFYVSTAAGIAATVSGDEFAVRATVDAPTADIYLNSGGSAVFSRTIIIAPAASGTSALLGHLRTNVSVALPAVPQAYGAVSNGTTNDSTAFSGAVTAKSNITGAAGGNYSIRDVALSNSQSYLGNGTRLNAATGAANLFTLANFNPRIADAYVSSSLNCSGPAFRVLASRFAYLTDVAAVNVGAGFVRLEPTTPASEGIAKPLLANLWAEGITGTGLLMGSSVSEMHMTNCHLYGQLQASTGGSRPSFTSTGWRQNTPVTGGFAVGGHLVTNANMLGFNIGWHLTAAQLSSYENCIADSCASYGVLIDGATSNVKFCDLFVGTTRGIKVEGSAQVWFDGLTTKFNGVIPPWGSTDFYNGVTTFYDMEVLGTANVRVSNWRGDKRIFVASTAKLTVDDGIRFQFRTIGTVGAAATGFLAEFGNTGTEADAEWRAPCDGHVVGFYVATSAAPGAGQTFTYTIRKNGANTTLTGQASGASAFATEVWCGTAPIAVAKGERIAMQLATSASAAASRHNGSILFLPE